MSGQEHRTVFASCAILIWVIFALPACSQSAQKQSPGLETAAGQNEAAAVSEAQSSGKTTSDSSVKTEPNSNVKTARGTYTGQIDGNSIEIRINGKPAAYRVSQKLFEVIDKLNEDDAVEIKYTQNEFGQLILDSISKQK
jgi:hypothetical protein